MVTKDSRLSRAGVSAYNQPKRTHSMLGMAKESMDILRKAIGYLEKEGSYRRLKEVNYG